VCNLVSDYGSVHLATQYNGSQQLTYSVLSLCLKMVLLTITKKLEIIVWA